MPEAKEVTLPEHNTVFSFRFASLNYQLQHRVHYQYMLEGYDKDWQTASKERMVTYANIPSGTYQLKVRASLLENPDKFDERVITVVVPPIFLLSSEAIWIYMVIGIVASIGMLFWIQRKIARKVDNANKS